MNAATLQQRTATGEAGASPAGPHRRRMPWRAVAGAVAILAALLVGAILTGGSGGGGLDPQSAGPTGSRAVAAVLGRQGVDVTRTTSTAETTAAVRRAGAEDTTVLLARTAPLSAGQLAQLEETGADLVLVEPTDDVLDELAPGLEVQQELPVVDAVPPQCDVPDAVAAGETTGGGVLVGPIDDDGAGSGDAGATEPVLCYGVPLAGAPYAALDAPDAVGADGSHRVVVLGQGAVLQNDSLAEEGNAALALRTLGGDDRLVWYLPDPLDPALDAEPTGLGELLPGGIRRALWYALLPVGLLLLWRGRRLGRLVPERLPVVVRATETLEGRGRLYRSAQAREHAAATLRSASLVRLASRLGLSGTADSGAVVRAAADAAGRPAQEVEMLYRSPAPRDDAGLVRLADALDTFEEEVRRS